MRGTERARKAILCDARAVDECREPKVREDNVEVGVEKDVLELDVAVHDAMGMAVLNGIDQLAKPDASTVLRDCAVADQVVEERAVGAELRHNVHVVVVLERVDQGDDVGVALHALQRHELIGEELLRGLGVLRDLLDGGVGGPVPARGLAHRGERPEANLAELRAEAADAWPIRCGCAMSVSVPMGAAMPAPVPVQEERLRQDDIGRLARARVREGLVGRGRREAGGGGASHWARGAHGLHALCYGGRMILRVGGLRIALDAFPVHVCLCCEQGQGPCSKALLRCWCCGAPPRPCYLPMCESRLVNGLSVVRGMSARTPVLLRGK